MYSTPSQYPRQRILRTQPYQTTPLPINNIDDDNNNNGSDDDEEDDDDLILFDDDDSNDGDDVNDNIPP